MTPKTRLKLIAGLLALSTIYALLVSISPEFARIVAVGYIALMLTILVLIQLWKKPHG